MDVKAVMDWFAGGEYRYHDLYHCLKGDRLWITITVLLDLAVAAGYALIAKHWWVNARTLPDIPAKRALGNMRNIFLFCGLCGYAFIPIKMVWPAWRLYDMFMVVLVYFTWKYAWGARDLKVVYAELGRTTQLAEDLATSQAESRRKSSFLNAISHDLRTPLNAMILQAHLAEVSVAGKDDAAAVDAVAAIRTSARQTAALLDSLLEYARLEATELPTHVADVSLAQLVADVFGPHEPAATERGLYLRSAVPDDLYVRTDRVKLERVLSNLVGNAVKFTHAGGVRVETDARGTNVEVHVIDTGIGIEPAAAESLFDEFVQAGNPERDRRHGFGLGLAISRRLARQLGGDVTVQSARGAGSRFTVLLPASRVDAPGGDGGEDRG